MTNMPAVYCEVAFTKDASGFRVWQDVSDFVEWDQGVHIARRRSHELDDVQPGTMSLTFDNSDGRFTAGRVASPYYPYLTLNRPIRIRARWPASPNLLLDKQATAADTALFSASGGLIAVDAAVFPAGQTSSIRWSNWSTGNLLRIGSTSTSSATDQALPVTAGRTYSLSAQVSRSSAAGASIAARIRWYSQTGAFISESTGSTVVLTVGTFQAVSVSAAAPAGAVCARPVLTTTLGTTSAVVYAGAWQFEQAAAPTAWTAPGREYRRYTGFTDRWPHAWSNGVLGVAAISATDRQKLLSRDRIRQALAEEVLATSPTFYYPLTEPSGSQTAGNQAATAQPDMTIGLAGFGGSAEFGFQGGPDSSTGVRLIPSNTSSGRFLISTLTTPLGGVSGISLAVWVNFLAGTMTGQNRLIYVDNGTDTTHMRVNYAPSSNFLSIGVRTPAGAAAGTSTAFNLDDGQLHLVVATAEYIGSTMRLRVYIDGTMAIDTSPTLSIGPWSLLPRVRVGGLPLTALDPAELMDGLVSHVAGWNTVLSQAQAAALSGARNGFAGELSGARMARIASWAGLTATAFDAGASLLDRHPGGEQTPLAAFKQAAFSDAGLFFMSGDDVAVFHDRNRRVLGAAATMTFTADQLGGDLQFVMDDQLLVNDVTVSRSGQTVTRVIDQVSIAENEGVYAGSLDTLLYSDTDALDRAAYTLSTYGHPQPRAGQISVDAHSLGTVWDQMLGSDIGQRISITGLPAEAPSTSLALWCEGVADTITDSTWRFVLDTSPVRDTPLFILDDAVYGTLDNNYLGW
ncbi:hypothetical protein [Nonomuraea sp. NPDC049758]|uniref:hypothetical protein n=1 Tax=Nonomuraea sp. NPDC049758 TaxID=3154360 RepID=UPI0034212592